MRRWLKKSFQKLAKGTTKICTAMNQGKIDGVRRVNAVRPCRFLTAKLHTALANMLTGTSLRHQHGQDLGASAVLTKCLEKPQVGRAGMRIGAILVSGKVQTTPRGNSYGNVTNRY